VGVVCKRERVCFKAQDMDVVCQKRIKVPGNLGSTGDEWIDHLQASVFDCLNLSMWLET
jgi:hypothetical protein